MMRARKFVGLFAALGLILAACGGNDTNEPAANNVEPETPNVEEVVEETALLDENRRFIEPVTISVALWDRDHERVPVFAESHWAEWVQERILEDHNIIVEWYTVPRHGEPEFQSTALAAGTAADIGYTFDNPMVTTMAGMGGMHNLYDLLESYRHLLPNLYDHLGENIYWNLDPDTRELWSITGRNMQHGRVVTFMREDWLETLGLDAPTTLEEFEATLKAFRDNAELLVDNPDRLVPYLLGADVAWDAGTLIESFIPSDITEREWFVHGFDDRRFHHTEAAKEATRVLNRWFHEDLLWNDFVVAEAADGHNLIRQGYVGAMTANWDMPFRAADRWTLDMRDSVGEYVNFIPVAPFLNDAGDVRKFFPNPTDRFIFFPTSNENPLASLLYLDFISRPDVLEYLQFGVEGIHRETGADGGITVLGETDTHEWPDHMFIPSANNFDITMTANGIAGVDTLKNAYPGITPERVLAARAIGMDNAYWKRQVQIRSIAAEEGMSGPLSDFRDQMLHRIIVQSTPETFDADWTREYTTYLALGAADIIAEREQAWVETFGDVDRMP